MMFCNKKILILLLLSMLAFSANAGGWVSAPSNVTTDTKSKTIDVELLINSSSKVKLKDIPTEGYIDVYSIIGALVMRINIKNCLSGEYSAELPKGFFILKAGKVTKKVLAK